MADFVTPHPLSTEAKFFQAFLEELGKRPMAVNVWNTNWSRSSWTAVAVSSLVAVVKAQGLRVAAKNHPDESGMSEYLGLDVIGYKSDYAAPSVVIEHENTGWKVPYCAWKVASVDARLRVLVAYWSPGSRGDRARSFEELQERVRLPMHSQPGKRLLLIGGGYRSAAKMASWDEIFRPTICQS